MTDQIISFNLAERLPAIRKAFEEKRMQIFTEDRLFCTYSGPCAVGSAMKEEELNRIVEENRDGDAISDIFAQGLIAATSQEQEALINLQLVHDYGMQYKVGSDERDVVIAILRRLIDSLCVRYGVKGL